MKLKEKIRIDGHLEEFSSRKEADDLIMSAREIVYNNDMEKNKKRHLLFHQI